MSSPCYYHPDQTAVASCVQCGMPICEQCRETVSDKSVCHRCVTSIRERLEREMPAAVSAPPVRSVPTPSASPSLVPLLTGTAFGIIVGVVGAFLLDKFTFYTHFQIGYINALIGFAIGFAVLFGAKQGGLIPGIIGGVIALASAVLGYGLLLGDMAAKEGLSVSTAEIMEHLPHYLTRLDALSWIIIAIGVYGGFKTPYRAGIR